LQITTNGSLMTPRWLSTLPRLPYRTITISLNAATPDTYLAVNRGVTWETVRRNIQELLRLRDTGRWNGLLRYSMVVLRRNLHEIRKLAELAIEDDADVRFMLPMRDLDGQTIMTSREAMEEAIRALGEVQELVEKHGLRRSAIDAGAKMQVLRKRLADGILDAM
jgi:molybdenum cofactor biosynthesis enzyme MoaA